MGRIRSIKPEFPHSESMGRVSRDARLTFILIWGLVDDSGRARASSRMLASLLFPYDDDAPEFIDGWLDELEGEGCIVRYAVEGTHYLQVCKWHLHQKIDRPSPSRIPPFDEASRGLDDDSTKTRRGIGSGSGIGSGIKDQGSTPLPPQGGNGVPAAAPEKRNRTPRDLAGRYRERFDEWWEIYDYKTAKGAAERAFAKVPADRLEGDLWASFIGQTRLYRDALPNKKTRLHPATWLNSKNYLDEDVPHHQDPEPERKRR